MPACVRVRNLVNEIVKQTLACMCTLSPRKRASMGAQVEEGMHGEEARRKLEHEVLEHKTKLAALSALLKATRKELFLQQEACEQQRGLLVAANKTIKQHMRHN